MKRFQVWMWLGLVLGLSLQAGPVTITNSVTGRGLVLGTGTYESGTPVTLRAAPQVDWKFDHWEGLPAAVATNNPVTVAAAIGLQPRAVFMEATGNGRFEGGTVVAWGSGDSDQTIIPAGLSGVTAIAGGALHTVALKSDGTVVAWGNNTFQQTIVPVGLSGVTAIAAGNHCSVALKSDGSIVAWGYFIVGSGAIGVEVDSFGTRAIAVGGEHIVALNMDGTVGAGGSDYYGESTVPIGLNRVTAVAAGIFHTVALKSDGTVVTWGWNGFGQTTVPVGLSGVTAIAANGHYTVALKSNGTVVAWGDNSNGQAAVPAGLSGVVAIAAGYYHVVALKGDGTVVAWGRNDNGQSTVPSGLDGVAAVAAGGYHTLALKEEGLSHLRMVGKSPSVVVEEAGQPIHLATQVQHAQRFQWYQNSELLPGSTSSSLSFNSAQLSNAGTYLLLAQNDTEALLTPPTLVGVYAREVVGNGQIIVKLRDAKTIRFTAKAAAGFKLDHWEGDVSGTAFQQTVTFTEAQPAWRLKAVFVPALQVTITPQVDGAGLVIGGGTYDEHALVPLHAAAQVDWKFDHWEGLPATVATNNQVTVEAAAGLQPRAVFVEATGNGRFQGGTVVAWGRNNDGQTIVPAGLRGVTAIATGGAHTVALKSDGTVVAWGYNEQGQTTVPAGLNGVTAIAAGGYHTVALKSNGTVVAWGANDGGQTTVPVGLIEVTAIAGGFGQTAALKSDGTVVAWGDNSFGQTTVPAGLSGVAAIAAGLHHTVALKRDGTVVAWGANGDGETTIPAGLSGVMAIAAGAYHTVALKSDGTVVAWGWNNYGQTTVPAGLSGVTAIAAGATHTVAMKRDATVVAWGDNSFGQSTVPAGLSGVTAIAAGHVHTVALKAAGLPHLLLIAESPSIDLVETGQRLRLAPQTLLAQRFQWYRNGEPLSGATSALLSINPVQFSDTGSYQLLAQNDTEALLTPPTEVRVVPVGYPRVLVNGVEVFTATRQGDSAEVRLTTTLPNGQLFYTLDGSEPSLDSTAYTGPFTVTHTVAVRAFAISGDFTQEATSTAVSLQIVPTYALSTALTGNGRIDRSPALTRYLQDDVVTVTAVPDAGWRFARWEGDLAGAFPERNVAMSREKSIRAVFEAIPRFTLTTLSQGGTATGAGTYYQGTTVNLTTAPAPGWSFLGWTGDHVGPETNFTWVVEGPAAFVANYGTTVSNLATGPGHVVLEPNLPVYPYGSLVKVIPVPDPGNYLALWGEAGVGQPKTEWTLTVTNAQPRVTALFRGLAADKVLLSAQATVGGRVSQPNADGLYPKGSVVPLTAVPESGYEFTGWSGDASGSNPQFTLTLDTSKTARAAFRRVGVVSFALNITVNGPGTVRRVPDLGAYEAGSEVELVAEPTGDAVLQGWSGAVTSTQRRVRLTVTNVTAVTATFLPVYPVATEVRGEGQVLLSPPEGRYAQGTSLALTAKPAAGWGFVQWSGDLNTTTQEAILTVDAPKRVIAEFARLGTLTTRVQGQGGISRTPDAAAYLPGTSVTLTATPAVGWKFVRWSGGATASTATLTVVVGRTEAIVAEFADAEAPVLTLNEPLAGTVNDEHFNLRGSATDNSGVLSVTWTRDGVAQGNLSAGTFAVTGLLLRPGTNAFTLTASDAAGNVSTVTRVVVWVPVRTLAVPPAAEVQEGQRLVFAVDLGAPGDVAGLTFTLGYDPVALTDPQVEWGALTGQSVNNVNLGTAGRINGSFALAGTALPAGTNRVANVSFRARSVPGVTDVTLTPAVVSVSGADGAALGTGNAAVAGTGRIKPRRFKGDNNANQRLDIGDAVVLSRLQVGLDEVRPWDVALNDLNESADLDSGDVVKVLRAVVGLDPQPKRTGRGPRLAGAGDAVNTNDVVGLEFPDGPVAPVGQPYRVVVRLARTGGPIAGINFTVGYPLSLNLSSRAVGALVPADALPFWNESPGSLRLAAVRSTVWPGTSGVVAVLTFTPTAEFAAQAEWPLSLTQAEVTGSGFDIRPLDDVAAVVRSLQTVLTPARVTLQPNPDGTLDLAILAPAGAPVSVESGTDLSHWTEFQRVTGLGDTTPVHLRLTPQPGDPARFWRAVRN